MQAQCAGQGLRQRRLADAGNVLDQQVAAGEQAGQRQPERGFLADDDAAQFGEHGRQSFGDGDGVGLGGAECHPADQSKKVPL